MTTQLKSIVERIEYVEGQRLACTEDLKEIYAEAKGGGFDVAVLRKVIARRKMDRADLSEFEAVLELYEAEVGA